MPYTACDLPATARISEIMWWLLTAGPGVGGGRESLWAHTLQTLGLHRSPGRGSTEAGAWPPTPANLVLLFYSRNHLLLPFANFKLFKLHRDTPMRFVCFFQALRGEYDRDRDREYRRPRL